MAIAFDKQLGSTATFTPAGTTVVLTTANAVASGGFIVLLVGWFGAASLSGVAGGSLTWTVDKTVANGSVKVAIVSAQAPSGLAASTAITATVSASSNTRGISGASFTGIATSAPVDTTASATSTATGWTGGGAITLNADDVVLGACMGDSGADTTSSPTATWTEVPPTAGDFNSGGNGDSFSLVYRIVAATGTYTPGGTWGVTNTNAGVSVAYMADTGGAATVPPMLLMAQPAAGGF